MFERKRRLLGGAAGSAALLVTLAACGGSSGATSGGAGSTAKAQTAVTVGVLTDVTGAAAADGVVDGVKAGTVYAAREGYKIKYIVADTATNPTAALAAAQKLVTQDRVTAVIANSAVAFSATTYLTAHNVPVIGFAEDGREWFTSPNMFSITGPTLYKEVTTTIGQFFKNQGVTSIGTLGYSVSPSSAAVATEGAASAKAVGLKVGYLNAQLPFGTTDVGPTVLAMKAGGVDGFFASVDANTAFSLITGLHNQGVNLKAALLPTGYGGELAKSGPGAQQAAQGAYFSLGYEPVELETAATKQFQSDLKAAGFTGEPSIFHYNGYISVGLLVRALKAAGSKVSSASLLTALRGIHDWDGLGLYGNIKYDINAKKITTGECLFVTRLEGSTFKPVKNASPICGSLTDQTISRSD
jgi:branched-chain amino acid transport system substrate-binding protein